MIPKVESGIHTQALAQGKYLHGGHRDALLFSAGNPFRRDKRGHGRYVSGTAFYVIHDRLDYGTSSIHGYLYPGGRHDGLVGVSSATSNSTPPTVDGLFGALPKPQPGLDALKPYGTTAIARTRPGRASADSMVTSIELAREGLPSLPGQLFLRLSALTGRRGFSPTHVLKASAGEYLNLQFGWKPLLSDIRNMYNTYTRLNKRLQQLIRDNGNGVRRRISLGKEETTTVVSDTSVNYPLAYSHLSPISAGPVGRTRRVQTSFSSTERWFAGKFRYYIPDIGSDQWTRRATAALFGANPSPEVLWNVLPWSWLADWFANVGDVVSNLSTNAAGRETLEYGFMMERTETRTTTEITSSCPGSRLGFYTCPAGSWAYSTRSSRIVKKRVQSTPYGFGLTYGGLSTYQQSILAAIGVRRW